MTQARTDQPKVLSANEIAMLALKAARGAGMTWGEAEEAGAAVIWLARRGVDGLGALLPVLELGSERGWDKMRPGSDGASGVPGDKPICPICLGMALSDRADLPTEPIGLVMRPVLLTPFLHMMAAALGQNIGLGAEGECVTVSPGGDVGGGFSALSVVNNAHVSLRIAEKEASGTIRHEITQCSESVLARLDEFALQTTVADADGSAADAGSGLSDND